MAVHRLKINAVEKGTFSIKQDFTDENAAAAAPKTLIWSLYNSNNDIINSREDVVPGGGMASTIRIVLSANDLALVNNDNRQRIVKVYWTIDSVLLGNDIPFYEEIHFKIINLENVT